MAAPRSVQFIALRNLSRGTHQVRNLHMTGPATYASNVLTKERPSMNLPHDIASLRNECKRRKIDFSGNKQDVSNILASNTTQAAALTLYSSSPASQPTRSQVPVPSALPSRSQNARPLLSSKRPNPLPLPFATSTHLVP
jgi:hypothetical protein